jgi:hypothetical protein
MTLRPIETPGINALEAELARGQGREAELRRLEQAADGERPEEAQKRFEEYFSTLMVKELRRGLGEGFFGSGAGSDTYDAWMDDFLGQSLAKSGAVDLSGMLEGFRAAALSGRNAQEAP